ncbi:glucose 1-dehydrogenase [Pseudacidovorax intermedius]|uniref:2-hydroxycyclohexanecarboxyl-CoA dehydrogenase n=1 Tax=Pseudacidovorax intermedius TaxID=433924 RepID=A0A147H414_9BURK|nr:glucose 1-dehydrogenase [Pseudacidovorax intermedius]KTT24682.1 2-hydroxycyclohexanecarboxyl-CoA dehydrogenase [Pseudacidovorax intermedius]
MRGLKNRVVVITGGAGGIGAALCRRMSEEGGKVAVFDLNKDAASELAAELSAHGVAARAYGVDISDYAQVQAAVADVEAKLGPIEVLVNNAGWDHAARFIDTNPQLWQKLIAINLVGPLNLQHTIVKGMIARGYGRIVNVSSDAGRVGSSGESVYSACKGGIISFSKTLAREVARKQITVNVVCPGPTETALFRDFAGEGESGDKLRGALAKAIPFGRLGQPEDVVGAVCFLASDEAAFITGQVLSVSGGLTMAG